jgi:aspartate/methionine/tyrosine aminotransferase
MKPFIVMQLLARAHELEAAGHSVIHLEVGEPDLPPPQPCLEAAVQAIRGNRTQYTASFGMWALREAIAGYYAAELGVEVDPRRVIVTTGTSAAFMLVLGGLFQRGQRVAVTDPGYPCYPAFCEFLGLESVPVSVEASDGYRPRAEVLDRLLGQGPIHGMILTSPSNPTGAVLPRATYHEVMQRVPLVISDEIYQGIQLDPSVEVFSGAGLGEGVVVIDGFSKKWSMTGERLGWCVVPEASLGLMAMLTQNLYICPPTSAQFAGLAALTEARHVVRERRAVYAERAAFLVPALEALGLRVPHRPQGAFYVYADVSGVTRDSYAFCFDLLERGHLAITPGADFGVNHAGRFVRFSLASSLANLREGVRRLEAYLGRPDRAA